MIEAGRLVHRGPGRLRQGPAGPKTGEILGTNTIGTDASILIQGVANAMRMGLLIDAITQSIYVHPALPESEKLEALSSAIAGLHSSQASQVLEHAWVVHKAEDLLDVVRDRTAEHSRRAH